MIRISTISPKIAFLSFAIFNSIICYLQIMPLFKNKALFYQLINPDITYICLITIKKFDSALFRTDFVLANNSIVDFYNQVELYTGHFLSNLLGDVHLQVLVMLIIFTFIYSYALIYFFYYFCNSIIISAAFMLFSCVISTFGFCSDYWAAFSFQCARSAMYALPFLAFSILFSVKEILNHGRYNFIYSYLLAGITFLIHPVSGYQLFIINTITLNIHNIVFNRNNLKSLLIKNGIGFFAFFIVTFASFIKIYSSPVFFNSKLINIENRIKIFQAFKGITPSYFCHSFLTSFEIPDFMVRQKQFADSMGNLFLMFKYYFYASSEISLVVIFLFSVLCATYIYFKRRNPFIEKYGYKILYIFSMILFFNMCVITNLSFATIGNSLSGKGFVVFALLIVIFIILTFHHLYLIHTKGSYALDKILLLFFIVVLLFDIGGSIFLTLYNEKTYSPLRDFNQQRGLKIAWIIFLVFNLRSLIQLTSTSIIFRFAKNTIPLSFFCFFVLYLSIEFKKNHSEPLPVYTDLFNMSLWCKENISNNDVCVFMDYSFDTWEYGAKNEKFKLLSLKNMYYSDDSPSLSFTDPNRLIEANRRLHFISNCVQFGFSFDDLRKEGINYLILPKVNSIKLKEVNGIVLFENTHYKVIKV